MLDDVAAEVMVNDGEIDVVATDETEPKTEEDTDADAETDAVRVLEYVDSEVEAADVVEVEVAVALHDSTIAGPM